jgi:hypothetical protein
MKEFLQRFFSTEYLFQINRVALTRADKVFLIIGLALVAIAVVVRIAMFFMKDRLKRGLFSRFFNLILTIGLLEVLWYGLRYEHVVFFGSHFVALIFLLIGLVWLGFIIKYWWKVYPLEKEKMRKENVKLKYL